MRTNLTKKDLVNLVYIQVGFSKNISENLIENFFLDDVKSNKRKNFENLKIWNIFCKTKKIKIRSKS